MGLSEEMKDKADKLHEEMTNWKETLKEWYGKEEFSDTLNSLFK